MTTATRVRPLGILLVEDSPTDALLAREALEDSGLVERLHHVEDGLEALQFLRRTGSYAQAPRPGLILLDLNLPRLSGRDLLATIKSDATLKTIPVVVLTTSRDEDDIARSYSLHANCYVTKPMEFTAFSDVVRSIQDYWFHVVTLPPERPSGDEPAPAAP